jgi:tetratricopeptide (TPR) repeat protein
MKQAAIFVATMALAGLLAAQTGTQTPPAAQPAAQAGAAATPAAKRPPQAKTQPEFDAYKAAMGSSNDTAAMEKASDDFATKYPDSELRILLYKQTMRSYQAANNADKMMDAGRKVLKIDGDDPDALIGVAEVLAERTRDTDLDKDQRLDEAIKLAMRATETVDTDVSVPAGTPQEKLDAYKGFLRSSAYFIMGTVSFNRDKFAEAEGYLRKSIDALPSQPDPIAVLRLAICLDKQEKYPEALKYAQQAVQLTQDGTNEGKVARSEQSRLAALTGSAPAAQPPK